MRHAVILAGGGGTRLWPASRRARPKQFLALGTEGESLLAATARRLATVIPPECVGVVTAANQVDLVSADLPWLAAGTIVSEPAARNTAAAVGLAAVHLLHRDPEAVMGAIPADQHIGDEAAFARIVDRAFAVAETHDVIATVGIVPTRAETGFGYIEVGAPLEDAKDVLHVARFVEKPDQETAIGYVKAGTFLWNGGMFFVKAKLLLAEIATHMPETAAILDEIAAALNSDGADAITAARYPRVPKVSLDFGVMEKSSRVVTLRGDFGWNDVGSWAALADYREHDANGNVVVGDVLTADATGNVIVTDDGTHIAAIGVHDLIIVKSGNAILVLPKARNQDVRMAVDALIDADHDQYL